MKGNYLWIKIENNRKFNSIKLEKVFFGLIFLEKSKQSIGNDINIFLIIVYLKIVLKKFFYLLNLLKIKAFNI